MLTVLRKIRLNGAGNMGAINSRSNTIFASPSFFEALAKDGRARLS